LDASITAGEQNLADDPFAAISGGYGNIASGDNSSISGGQYNLATDVLASIAGGCGNLAGSEIPAQDQRRVSMIEIETPSIAR
jgi:hypothetical protein